MSSQPPLVTIIMPVYNGEAFLREAIDSILAQTYTNWELLVMNDGSTDSSRDIAISYTSDPRIRVIDNEKNMGIIATKNRAIDIARGKYIATLDADDIALPTRIGKQVAFMEKHKDCGLCGTLHQEIDAKGELGTRSYFPTSARDVKTYLLVANCICHSATMLRADLMKATQYDPEYYVAEDFELWDRVGRTHFIANLTEILTYYRVHGNNISITKKEKMFETVKKLTRRIFSDASIRFTERELEIHSDLVSYTNQLNTTPDAFKEMEKWVISITSQVKGRAEYNQDLLYSIMCDRYIVACVRNKRYLRMLWNPVMQMKPVLYFRILATKMRGRHIKFEQKTEL